MKLNKDFELCVRLYSHLGKEPKSCLKLSTELGTSRNYLHKLTGILNRAGLLKITNGAQGGISNPERTVTTLDVFTALGNDYSESDGDNIYSAIVRSIITMLRNTTLHRGKNA